MKVEKKEDKPKLLKFGGFIEKEYKSVGAEVLDEHMPFSEGKILNCFVNNIKKEFPVEIEVKIILFSLLKSIMLQNERQRAGKTP